MHNAEFCRRTTNLISTSEPRRQLEGQASAHHETDTNDDLRPANNTANMSEGQVTLRTRKFIRNPLLGRKQMVVCVRPEIEPRTHRHIAIRGRDTGRRI